jgi:hypothetical protein
MTEVLSDNLGRQRVRYSILQWSCGLSGVAGGYCIFSFASRLFLRAGLIRSDWFADHEVTIAYCLGDVTGVDSIGGRVRSRLIEEMSSGLSKVCQVVRVDQILGGAYLVDDVRWFDGALRSSLGCSLSYSKVESVLVALQRCLDVVLLWFPSRFLRTCRSSAFLLRGLYR